MKEFLEIAERTFVVIALTFFTGGFSASRLIPNPIIQIIRYLILFGAFILVIMRWKTGLKIAVQDCFFWILTIIILFSFLWSDHEKITLLNNREVLQMSFFGLYFATRYSLKEQIKLIALTFFIGAILSIILALAIPSLGQHGKDHPGAWKGIYDYKNTFGSMMVLSSLAFFLLPVKKSGELFKWTGFGLSLLCILLSTSKTSLVVFVLLLSTVLFYRNFRWQGKITILILDITILISGCVATVMLSNWVAILTGLGRDPTLTGRTPMWGVMISRLMERPWLGYGRGSFWAPGSQFAREAGRAISASFVPPHGHNGFIDLALDVGLIGLCLFLISFSIAFTRALKRAYATQNPEDIWPLAFLIFLAMNNMTESFLLRLANVYWVLYITAAFSVAQPKQSQKLQGVGNRE
jgi:exopolysaccharide production protein ExoQ